MTGPRRRRFLPPQHGAWAILIVPYLAGLLAAGWSWPDLPLLIAWLSGYLLSYYLLQALKTGRWQRSRDQLGLYGAIAIPAGALVVIARPEVLRIAPGYAVLLAVNVGYSWRRRERDLMNNAASIVQSCLIIFVVAAVQHVEFATVGTAFALCLLYFFGTVLYVKTMIRERGNVAFQRWSAGYHLLALIAAGLLDPWSLSLFAWLLTRSVLLPGQTLTPKQVGLVEIGNCVILSTCIALH